MTSISYTYTYKHHCAQVLDRLQSNDVSRIPTEVIDTIKKELKDQDISTKSIRDVLREHRLQKYYENCQKIMYHLTNGDPPDLKMVVCLDSSTDEYEFTSDDCSICLETVSEDNHKRLDCKHIFHKECIGEWMKSCTSENAATCPNCRSVIIIHKALGNKLDEIVKSYEGKPFQDLLLFIFGKVDAIYQSTKSTRSNHINICFGFEKISQLLLNHPNMSKENKDMLRKLNASLLHQVQSKSFWKRNQIIWEDVYTEMNKSS